MHICSFEQLKPTTVPVLKPQMLDLNDPVFWTFSLLLSCIPLPNDVYIDVICWHWLEARATWRTTCKSVREGTRCVHYLIPRSFLALVILLFKIISFSHETDAGQPSIFVQIVEVIVNLRSNSLMAYRMSAIKVSHREKIKCSHNYLLKPLSGLLLD